MAEQPSQVLLVMEGSISSRFESMGVNSTELLVARVLSLVPFWGTLGRTPMSLVCELVRF